MSLPVPAQTIRVIYAKLCLRVAATMPLLQCQRDGWRGHCAMEQVPACVPQRRAACHIHLACACFWAGAALCSVSAPGLGLLPARGVDRAEEDWARDCSPGVELCRAAGLFLVAGSACCLPTPLFLTSSFLGGT